MSNKVQKALSNFIEFLRLSPVGDKKCAIKNKKKTQTKKKLAQHLGRGEEC